MSSHVDDDTLEYLRKQKGELPYPWLARFHKHHWGVPNGTSFTFDASGSPTTVTCINNLFDIQPRSPLLVRRAYIGLWNYLRRVWFEEAKPRRSGTIIYGHPGIGKSLSLYYLMCAAAEQRIPFVFHRTDDDDAFVCLDVGSFVIPAPKMPKISLKGRGLVLVDCTTAGTARAYYAGPKSHVVLASSPAPSRYHAFYKHAGAMFFTMPLVSVAEFRAMLELRSLVPDNLAALVTTVPLSSSASETADSPTGMDVDSDEDDHGATTRANEQTGLWDPLEVFTHYGPNARWALRPHLRNPDGMGQLLPRTDWADILRISVAKYRALDGSLCSVVGPRAIGFNTFFFDRPDPSGLVTLHAPQNPVVPTPFLRGVVRDALSDMKYEEQLHVLSRVHGLGAVHGVVFEGVVLNYLASAYFTAFVSPRTESAVSPPEPTTRLFIGPGGNSTQESYVVSAHQPASPTPPRETTTRAACEGNARGVTAIEDRLGFSALPPGFAGADAVLLAEGADDGLRYEVVFRVAVSASRGDGKPRGLDSIGRALDAHPHAARRRRRLFLFVSDSTDKCERLAAGPHPHLQGWEIGYVVVTEGQLLDLGNIPSFLRLPTQF